MAEIKMLVINTIVIILTIVKRALILLSSEIVYYNINYSADDNKWIIIGKSLIIS